MSLHLRVALGPVVLIDCELFRLDVQDKEPPPQLNGGQGAVIEPYAEGLTPLGFSRRS